MSKKCAKCQNRSVLNAKIGDKTSKRRLDFMKWTPDCFFLFDCPFKLVEQLNGRNLDLFHFKQDLL